MMRVVVLLTPLGGGLFKETKGKGGRLFLLFGRDGAGATEKKQTGW